MKILINWSKSKSTSPYIFFSTCKKRYHIFSFFENKKIPYLNPHLSHISPLTKRIIKEFCILPWKTHRYRNTHKDKRFSAFLKNKEKKDTNILAPGQQSFIHTLIYHIKIYTHSQTCLFTILGRPNWKLEQQRWRSAQEDLASWVCVNLSFFSCLCSYMYVYSLFSTFEIWVCKKFESFCVLDLDSLEFFMIWVLYVNLIFLGVFLFDWVCRCFLIIYMLIDW